MKKEIHELFEDLTGAEIEGAAKSFDADVDHDFHESTKFDILINGKRYPPKAIVGIAATSKSSIRIVPADFSAGLRSKCFSVLEGLGFSIVPKTEVDEVTGPPQRDVVAWVLQGNPEYYDIDQYFTRQNYIYWKLAEICRPSATWNACAIQA